jgi:plasmid maintenance system antidote protein VapI
MPMKNPPHPGGVVLRQCLEALVVGITEAAALVVTRTTLSKLVKREARDFSRNGRGVI